MNGPRDLPTLGAPTEADLELAFADVDIRCPDASAVLRRALAHERGKTLSVDLLREVIATREKVVATLGRVVDEVDSLRSDLREPIRRAIAALEAEIAAETRAVALAERTAEESRTHLQGAWTTAQSLAGNRAFIGGAAAVVGSLGTFLLEALRAWWTP